MKGLLSCFPSFSGKQIWKMFPLLLGEVLVVFVNRSPADGMYAVHGSENLQLRIQMQLSEKRKSFWEFFVPFLESTSNFKSFEKKRMIVIANVFPKLGTVKIFLRPLSIKRRFRRHFDTQHVKKSQILAKSPWERFCHVFSSFSGKVI